tara:strand:- start:2445 stop:2774 length:330 start_codon:yes stop_codon:yes gene_type:complete
VPNNLPVDYRDCSADEEVIVDKEGHFLTHYVLAERLIQVEYKDITDDMDPQSDTLIYILEGGFRGFHKYTKQQLRDEWLDGAEGRWFQLYEDGELPWEPYEEDPICKVK